MTDFPRKTEAFDFWERPFRLLRDWPSRVTGEVRLVDRDARLGVQANAANYGAADLLYVGRSDAIVFRSLISVSLDGVSEGDSLILQLTHVDAVYPANNSVLVIQRCLRDFEEGARTNGTLLDPGEVGCSGARYANSLSADWTSTACGTDGSDYTSLHAVKVAVPAGSVVAGRKLLADVTQLARDALAAGQSRLFLRLTEEGEVNGYQLRFASREHVTEAWRPTAVLDYVPTAGMIDVAERPAFAMDVVASLLRMRGWIASASPGRTVRLRGFTWCQPLGPLRQPVATPLFDITVKASGGVIVGRHPVDPSIDVGDKRFYEFSEIIATGFLLHGDVIKSMPGPFDVSYPAEGVDEVQTLTINGTADYTLAYLGEKTALLAYNASRQAIQAALESLSTIGDGNVEVAGLPGGPYTIVFRGDLGGQEITILCLSEGAHRIARTTRGAYCAMQLQIDKLADLAFCVEPYDTDGDRVVLAVKEVQ